MMKVKEKAMIELTEKQRMELTAMESPEILDPATGMTYMLVPTEPLQAARQDPGRRSQGHGRNGRPADGGGGSG